MTFHKSIPLTFFFFWPEFILIFADNKSLAFCFFLEGIKGELEHRNSAIDS